MSVEAEQAKPAANPDAEHIAGLLAEKPLFADVPRERLVGLVERATRIAFAAGELLISKGDPSSFALFVIEGSVEVSIPTSFSVVNLASLPAPCLVGEVGVFTGVARTADVRALTPVAALRFEGPVLQRIGEENPRFLAAAMRELGGRIETFNRAIGFYTNALSALRRHDFDLSLLDALRNPIPELAHFSESFRLLAEEIMVRKTQRQEMANAAAIQRSMLPSPLPLEATGERVRVTADMRPAKDVGGDFYDFFLIGPDKLAVSVGDVSGKGVPASLFMTAAQTIMRIVLRQPTPLAEQVQAANDILSADNREMMFVTFFCALIDLTTGAVDYCNAGHNPPLILRRGGGVDKPDVSNIALGMMEGARFRAGTLQLMPGDRLFLFTDGLPDALDGTNAAFGDERVEASARAHHTVAGDAFVIRMHDDVEAFAGGASQFDDLTSVSIEFFGKKSESVSAFSLDRFV